MEEIIGGSGPNYSMRDNTELEQPTKKSLMESFKNLENKAIKLKELADYSDMVVDLFNNPFEGDSQVEVLNKTIDKKPMNLIDLFNDVSDKIEISIGRLGRNIEKIKNFIK